MKTELELFAERTLIQGGKWWHIAESRDFVVYKSQSIHMVRGRKFGDTPVYQVFDKATGKRLYATTNMNGALSWVSMMH